MAGEGGEEVFCLSEGVSGELCEVFGHEAAEVWRGVEAGADGGGADGELVEGVEGVFDGVLCELELCGVSAEFLSEC